MKRIVKNPDVRRAEIIQAAQKLFKKTGYTNTPVEAIIKEAGIAKGTFYYYFKSKNEILHAIVDNICADVEDCFNSIINNDDLNAVQKLKQMIRGPVKKEKLNSLIMNVLHKPENRELQEELNIKTIKIIAPILHKAIEQGHKEGVFNQLASLESIQIILAGSQFVLDSGLFKWTSKKQNLLLQAIELLFELVTDAKPNALSYISKTNGK